MPPGTVEAHSYRSDGDAEDLRETPRLWHLPWSNGCSRSHLYVRHWGTIVQVRVDVRGGCPPTLLLVAPCCPLALPGLSPKSCLFLSETGQVSPTFWASVSPSVPLGTTAESTSSQAGSEAGREHEVGKPQQTTCAAPFSLPSWVGRFC